MPRDAPRALILDPDFEHAGGHNYLANRVLAGHLTGEVRIACPLSLDDAVTVPGAKLFRVFPANSYAEEIERDKGPLRRLTDRLGGRQAGAEAEILCQSFGQVIADQLAGMAASSRDAILVHTGSTLLFRALLSALESWPRSDWPSLHLRQVRPLVDAEEAASIHARLRDCRRFTEFHLYVETKAFADQLVAMDYRRDELDLLEVSDLGQPLTPAPSLDDTIRVAVLGTVRREKGYGQLAAIATSYRQLAAKRNLPELAFAIHASAIKNVKLFRRMTQQLDRAAINYELVKTPPGMAAHWQVLTTSHVALTPYEADRYINRGSAICVDAIAQGRPMVLPAGSTLEEYLRGTNGLAAAGVDGFAEALARIADDYLTYARGARDAAEAFRAHQLSHPLFSRLAKESS